MQSRPLLFVVAILGAVLAMPSYAQLSMLHASGLNVVNADGQVLPLRGVNLGKLVHHGEMDVSADQ
jgi:hypothetical protein